MNETCETEWCVRQLGHIGEHEAAKLPDPYIADLERQLAEAKRERDRQWNDAQKARDMLAEANTYKRWAEEAQREIALVCRRGYHGQMEFKRLLAAYPQPEKETP